MTVETFLLSIGAGFLGGIAFWSMLLVIMILKELKKLWQKS